MASWDWKVGAGAGLSSELTLLHRDGWSLDSSPCTQTGNFSASNVIEFMASCSSTPRLQSVFISKQPNSRAVVSCGGWPLSDQIMWRRPQAGWQIDGFSLISSGRSEERYKTWYRWFLYLSFPRPCLQSGCARCVQSSCSLWWVFYSSLQRNV